MPLKVMTSMPLIYNPAASTIPKWRAFEFLGRMQNFYRSRWGHEILYAGRSSEDKQLFNQITFVKNKNTNMDGGWYLKFTFCYMETTHEPMDLDKTKFSTMKDHGHTWKFYLNYYFLLRSF
jgi:hypothetical protein